MNTEDITVTDGRLLRALNNTITNSTTSNSVKNAIEEAKEDSMVQEATLTKYYSNSFYIEAKLSNGEIVKAKTVSPFCSDALLYVTPEGEWMTEEDSTETYVKPRADIPCYLAPVNTDSEFKYVLLGFYIKNTDQILYNAPFYQGFELRLIGATSMRKISFSIERGFSIDLDDSLAQAEGDYDNMYTETRFTDYYTQEEIDEEIDGLKKEIEELKKQLQSE